MGGKSPYTAPFRYPPIGQFWPSENYHGTFGPRPHHTRSAPLECRAECRAEAPTQAERYLGKAHVLLCMLAYYCETDPVTAQALCQDVVTKAQRSPGRQAEGSHPQDHQRPPRPQLPGPHGASRNLLSTDRHHTAQRQVSVHPLHETHTLSGLGRDLNSQGFVIRRGPCLAPRYLRGQGQSPHSART